MIQRKLTNPQPAGLVVIHCTHNEIFTILAKGDGAWSKISRIVAVSLQATKGTEVPDPDPEQMVI